jgi:prepilin-type processing-associated H-X9-DG protein
MQREQHEFMKLKHGHQNCTGLTLVEVLYTVAVVAMLIGMVWYSTPRSRRSTRIVCVSNLKQSSLALQIWAGDHGDKFPFQVSTNQGGSLEYTRSKEVFRHFLAISNELGNSKVLHCPADKERTWAVSFTNFNNQHLSYFLTLNPTGSNKWSVLGGDRNIAAFGQNYANGNYAVASNKMLSWGQGIHQYQGNLSFADGHSEQSNSNNLMIRMSNTGQPANWLAFP